MGVRGTHRQLEFPGTLKSDYSVDALVNDKKSFQDKMPHLDLEKPADLLTGSIPHLLPPDNALEHLRRLETLITSSRLLKCKIC